MSKILCPVDFSDSSLNAIEYAANFAGQVGAELVLLHTEPKYRAVLKEGDDTRGVVGEVEGKLNTMANEVTDQYGIACSYRFDFANLLDDIKEITSGSEYGMIVMGTDGISNVREYHLGSNTAQVAMNTRCSLLSVPDTMSYEKPKHVVFAVDGPGEGHEKILNVIAFARSFEADVTILHVDGPNEANVVDDDFRQTLLGKLNSPDWLRFEELKATHIANKIMEYVNGNKGSMLVVTTRDLADNQGPFHDSVTRELVEVADFPVLVFHA